MNNNKKSPKTIHFTSDDRADALKELPENKLRTRGAEELSYIMDKMISNSDIGKKIRKFNIFNHWPDIVGCDIGRKTKPEKLLRQTLYISVTSSTWANELSLMSEQLIKKINDFAGESIVKELRFKTARQ